MNTMQDEKNYGLGIEVGSTTAKVVLTDGAAVIYEIYERHFCAE